MSWNCPLISKQYGCLIERRIMKKQADIPIWKAEIPHSSTSSLRTIDIQCLPRKRHFSLEMISHTDFPIISSWASTHVHVNKANGFNRLHVCYVCIYNTYICIHRQMHTYSSICNNNCGRDQEPWRVVGWRMNAEALHLQCSSMKTS